MKRFITYTAILLIVLVLLSVLFDLAFTYVYNNGTHRNKVMWMRDLQGENVDFIVLGSSRANNHVDAKQIFNETGKKGFNLGVNGFGAFESQIMLREFLKKNNTKQVFVQIDGRYRKDAPDPVGEKVWLPYLYEESIYNEFKEYGSEYSLYKYIPFYRYAKFESRLGYRDIVTSLLGKGHNYFPKLGFTPRNSMLSKDKPYTKNEHISKENMAVNKMIDICKQEGVAIYFFTTPIYRFEADIAALKKYVPNYKDFKDSIPQIHFYGDNLHLNEKGAKRFTEMFIATYFSETP